MLIRSSHIVRLLLTCSLVLLVSGVGMGHSESAAHPNEIPFVEHNGFILIEGTLDGEIGNFILDTGTDGLIINDPEVAGDKQDFETIDQAVALTKTDVSSFKVASRTWLDFNAYALDLAFLEEHLSRSIRGIVGISFVLPERILIDYTQGVIRVNEANHPSASTEGMELIGRFPIDWSKDEVPALQCEIDGRMFKLGIDSGAGQNILFGSKAKKLCKKSAAKVKKEVQVVMPDNKDLALQMFQFDSLQIGSIKVKEASFLMHRGARHTENLDGLVNLYLLGFDQFIIDTKKKELLLFRQRNIGLLVN